MRALMRGCWGVALLVTLQSGCSSDSKGDADNARASGGLPCDGPSVDCRLAFSGDYTGTFEGADTGTLTIYINVIGGMEGTAKGAKLGSPAINGQVDEFGKLVFTAGDGEFTGQFKADHSFNGTWDSASGTGTFKGDKASATGTGGTGGGSGNGGGLLDEARAACQATLACEGAPADCSKVAAAPPGCETLEHATYQCVKAAGCAFATTCKAQTDALVQCVVFGTQPDPGTGYTPSGNDTYDEATVICVACQAEAKACHDLPACWDYAECAEACPSGETYCVDNCWDANPTGHDAWFDAVWCESNQCFGL